MKNTKLQFAWLGLLFCSIFAYANERFDTRENSLKKTNSYAVLVTPLEGKMGCDIFSQYDFEKIPENCYDNKKFPEISEYNDSKKLEVFLVLKSLRGNRTRGSLISVNYANVGMNHLSPNKIYLIFFHEKNGSIIYEPCDVIEYSERVNKILAENFPYDETINMLLDYATFSCFQEPPALIFDPKKDNKGKDKK